ncbi:hypothetical protein C8F01DRAFT_1330284 [Mycena amicta]|nr:hypothetical protein C8F01DRAFT_1330284 [Mycena amicta]
MLLPFGLKLAWFAVSLTGVIGCWAALLPLALATRRFWAPVAYAAGITLLEAVFWLGLIWRMEPAKMPVAFCLVQVLGFGLSSFFLTGLIAALTTATTIYVAKPKQWVTLEETSLLKWRAYYLLPILVFPLLASTVQVTFVIFFSNFDNANGMVCVPNPLWLRFLSYAGPPLFITPPCLFFTLRSIIRVFNTHAHIRRARRSVNFNNLDRFTVRPTRSRKSKSRTPTTPTTPRGVAVTLPSPSPSARVMTMSPRREAVTIEDKPQTFHLPLGRAASPKSEGYSSRWDEHSFDTVSSVSFAEITATNTTNNTRSNTMRTALGPSFKSHSPLAHLFGRGAEPHEDEENDDVHTPLRSNSIQSQRRSRSSASHRLAPTPTQTTQSGSIRNSDRVSPTQLAAKLQYKGDLLSSNTSDSGEVLSEHFDDAGTTTDEPDPEPLSPPPESNAGPAAQYRKLPSLVRSLLAFQLTLIFSQLLSVITPLADLAHGGQPAVFGTQHVALIVVAWAPLLTFGPPDSVRSYLAFCRDR